ncbi:MAG: universal stress protein [Chloroflexi bacterium]|nr:universal stress protein [Chloroflexota bacterium]
MYNKILVPLDGSSLAEQALPHAIELAQKFNSEIHLIQVIVQYSGAITPYELDYKMTETFREAAIREAHEYLHRIEGLFIAKGIKPVAIKVIEGMVAESILEYAAHYGIQLIVMGTHGRSGVGRWVFGSVAEKVLRVSDCPVFLVRATAETK